LMSALPNSSRRVMAGKTAQNPSQYRQALQICRARPTSASFTVITRIGMTGPPPPREEASRVNASSVCMVMLLEGRAGRVGAGDAAGRSAYAHADTGGVALAEHVAGHHFAGGEQVGAGAAAQ